MDGWKESFVVGVGRILRTALSLVCRASATSEAALVRSRDSQPAPENKTRGCLFPRLRLDPASSEFSAHGRFTLYVFLPFLALYFRQGDGMGKRTGWRCRAGWFSPGIRLPSLLRATWQSQFFASISRIGGYWPADSGPHFRHGNAVVSWRRDY